MDTSRADRTAPAVCTCICRFPCDAGAVGERGVNGGPPNRWVTPLTWRILLFTARVVVGAVCRLQVTGDLSPQLRSRFSIWPLSEEASVC